jgi:dihydrofolate reductase
LIGPRSLGTLTVDVREAEREATQMRKVVMGMMTTLNGRLDDPAAWVTGVPGYLYAELDRLYGTFDTILVGRTTYAEMVEYWPGAEADEDTPPAGKSMARKMNAYKKYVFTGASETAELEWNNAELVPVRGDDDIARFLDELKSQPGGDIHLSGGARLAQTVIRLGLVDLYHLVVHPVVSAGAQWFDPIDEPRRMNLQSATAYSNGVVGLYYEPLS